MSMFKLLLAIFFFLHNTQAKQIKGPNLGQPADSALIKLWNRDVFSHGKGLPEGRGTGLEGKLIYQQHCLSCHGVEGTGGSAEELAGAQHSLTDNPPDKVIGNYWPYATTIFDFIRRSMPLDNPGILSNDDLYAVTAYLLYLNDIISEKQPLDRTTLTLITMPNQQGFINVYQLDKSKMPDVDELSKDTSK